MSPIALDGFLERKIQLLLELQKRTAFSLCWLIHNIIFITCWVSANILLYQQQGEANAGQICISPKEAWYKLPQWKKCRSLFVCLFLSGSLAWNQLGDVVSVGSSNVKAIDVESFVLLFPTAWKIVSPSPPPPPNQIPAKQAAVSKISQ